MAIQHYRLAESGPQPIPEGRAESSKSISTRIQTREAARRPQRGDEEHVLGAGASPGLVSRAVHQRFQLDTSSEVQGADAFRRIDLMAGHA